MSLPVRVPTTDLVTGDFAEPLDAHIGQRAIGLLLSDGGAGVDSSSTSLSCSFTVRRMAVAAFWDPQLRDCAGGCMRGHRVRRRFWRDAARR